MATNACSNGASNTGQPSCVPKKNVDAGIILVKQVADDGAVNKILSSDAVDASYVSALINNTDTSKRWYPVMNLKTVIGERAEPTTQDIDGVSFNTKVGTRTYDGMVYGAQANPQFEGVLNSFANGKYGYYKIDINGNLTGILNEDGDLIPIKIELGTLFAVYKEPTATEVQNVHLKFMVKESVKDSDLRTLDAQTITTDLLEISGLIDVTGVATSPSTTGFVLTNKVIYGNPFVLPAFSGAVLADYVVYNETTTSAVVVTSVTEGADGVYTFVMPAQTSADVLTVTLSKVGFEMSPVTVTIP